MVKNVLNCCSLASFFSIISYWFCHFVQLLFILRDGFLLFDSSKGITVLLSSTVNKSIKSVITYFFNARFF